MDLPKDILELLEECKTAEGLDTQEISDIRATFELTQGKEYRNDRMNALNDLLKVADFHGLIVLDSELA